MDVLYFAFANDAVHPLKTLQQEDNEINTILEPLAAKGHFKIIRDSYASLDSIAEKLMLYKDQIVLFHFGGHAGNQHLQLDSGKASALGISELLGKCPRLKVVILNGCATIGQVELLHSKNIPIVIGTYRPIEDKKAFHFELKAVVFQCTLHQ